MARIAVFLLLAAMACRQSDAPSTDAPPEPKAEQPTSRRARAHFSFAGLSRATTQENLRNRYRTSNLVSHYVYVSDADSHDHIYGVEIPSPGGSERFRLSFGRKLGTGSPRRFEYPPCDSILSRLQSAYGKPLEAYEYHEEAMRSRLHRWEQQGEELRLQCFYTEDGSLLAEAISIVPSSSP
jgi:hypothetical protein